VSGFGPRSLGLAARHGDGAIFPLPPHPAVLEHFWEHVEAGARESGRELERSSCYTAAREPAIESMSIVASVSRVTGFFENLDAGP